MRSVDAMSAEEVASQMDDVASSFVLPWRSNGEVSPQVKRRADGQMLGTTNGNGLHLNGNGFHLS